MYIGIDGEGQGRQDHRYVLLAASRESGDKTWFVEAEIGPNPLYGTPVPEGEVPHPKETYIGRLSTKQCLNFILGLKSKHSKIFAYSFNYDLTKILEDLPNEKLYLLFRPDLRQRNGKDAMKGPYSVKWDEFRLNLQGTKFTVSRGFGATKERVVIWDIFKFFQAKFVSSLKDWKVGSAELHARMSDMKDKRGEFDRQEPKAVRDYCLEECQCIGELTHRLVSAHEAAELELKTFYGAGSSGAAMLTKMGIRECIVPCPEAMKVPVACGFFGGRFENSVIGAIHEPLYNYDISSAYPYHTTFLPCLRHGTWRLTKDRRDITGIESVKAALVSYTLGPNPGITTWGPFPFRGEDGSISFPIESGGGWVWRDEFLAGERIFRHVRFQEAWVYTCECDCQPFVQIPTFYKERLKLGKEGPGIVIKLAVNSCYGKLAQSVGNALFNSWIWAGIITSNCRAQILDMLALHRDWRNLLMVATDGIYTRERFVTTEPDKDAPPITSYARRAPVPRDTRTTVEYTGKNKPLGGWEEKYCPKGVFVARPGIYFPLEPTADEIKAVRARGVGRGVVLNYWKVIVDAWEKHGVDGVARVPDVTRFCGAKTSIVKGRIGYSRAMRGRAKKGGGYLPAYGQWIKRRVEMKFDPKPKREKLNVDGRTLQLRVFPRHVRSLPYDNAMKSADAREMAAAVQEAIEQPDGGDLTDYDMNTTFEAE